MPQHFQGSTGGPISRRGIKQCEGSAREPVNFTCLKQFQGSAGEPITIEEMLKLQCDVFIPAAVPDVIDEKVARELNCRYVVEAANGPTTVEGDKVTVHSSLSGCTHILFWQVQCC